MFMETCLVTNIISASPLKPLMIVSSRKNVAKRTNEKKGTNNGGNGGDDDNCGRNGGASNHDDEWMVMVWSRRSRWVHVIEVWVVQWGKPQFDLAVHCGSIG
jgi:hypothetical protein